jgi:hypothetical protein
VFLPDINFPVNFVQGISTTTFVKEFVGKNKLVRIFCASFV